MSGPRWQIGLVDVLLVLTLAAVLFGLTSWMSRDFGSKASQLVPLAISVPVVITLALNAMGYWISRLRGGPLRYRLRLATTIPTWIARQSFLLACCLALYFVYKLIFSDPAASNGAIILLWMFGTHSVVSMFCGSLRMHEEGVVTCTGFGWTFSSWNRCRKLTWEFDDNGNLVIGHGLWRATAIVPPEHRAAVEAVLKEKLKTD